MLESLDGGEEEERVGVESRIANFIPLDVEPLQVILKCGMLIQYYMERDLERPLL